MSWITVIWSMIASACLTLAAVHGMVWCMKRTEWSNLLFALTAVVTAMFVGAEFWVTRAQTPDEYATSVLWAHLPIWMALVSLAFFVRQYLRAGRTWLLWTFLVVRTLALLLNFLTGQNLNYREITSLRFMSFLGESLPVAVGQPNPWMLTGHLGSLLLILFVADASVSVWRRGERRKALLVGGSSIFFVLGGQIQAMLVFWGNVQMPIIISWFYMGIVLAMNLELSRDVLRSARLATDLQTSEQRLKLAAAAGRLALWEWDIRADRIWISNEGRMLYGLGPEESFDFKRFASTLHADDRQSAGRALEEALAGPEPFAVEYRAILPDGAVRWIAAGGRVERDAQGRPTLLRGVSLDVTERKLAEQETARHRYELAHLSRVSILGELAGAIAHELNQPLAAMLSNSQVGRRSLDAGEPDLVEMAAIFDDIAADAKRAGGIIHGMRAMFRKDSTVQPQPVDLNEAVNQAVSLLHSEIVSRKVRVDLQLGESLPFAKAGRVEIQQVLINLILNSLDAVKACNGRACIEISTAPQDSRVMLSVRDNGPGIAPEVLGRLFEPFASTKPGGLGLGLAISRTIARRFGGELGAENHPDGGAVFRLVLPQANE